MLAFWLPVNALFMIRHVPCIPDLSKTFNMKGCWILSWSLFPAIGSLSPYNCPDGPQWERMSLSLLGPDVWGGVVPKGDSSQEKGWRQGQEGCARVRLGREEGRSCDPNVKWIIKKPRRLKKSFHCGCLIIPLFLLHWLASRLLFFPYCFECNSNNDLKKLLSNYYMWKTRWIHRESHMERFPGARAGPREVIA